MAVLVLLSAVSWSISTIAARPAPGEREIVVYGFSILGEAMQDGIFPAFAERRRRETGEKVRFYGAFAGSGTIANQILFGAPADVAIFAVESDADRLADARLVRRDWRQAAPDGAVVTRTAMVIETRPGNPLGLRSFDDLGRPGVKVVHPDPATSGGAQWALFAEWACAPPGREAEQLGAIWANVISQASSARGAKTQFERGFGDALVTYELEVLTDRRKQRPIELVVPPCTVLAENVAVVVDRNVAADEREAVQAFRAFLSSDEARLIFARFGFRTGDERLDRSLGFAPLERAVTVRDLGGFAAAQKRIVFDLWRDRILSGARGRSSPILAARSARGVRGAEPPEEEDERRACESRDSHAPSGARGRSSPVPRRALRAGGSGGGARRRRRAPDP